MIVYLLVLFLVFGSFANSQDTKIEAVELILGFDFRTTENKGELFELNYDQSKTYVYPENPQIKFLVPDEETISNRQISVLSSNLQFFNSYSKIVDYSLSKYKVKEENGTYAEETEEFEWIRERLSANETCAIFELYYSHYLSDIDPYIFLTYSKSLEEDIDQLPERIESEEDKEKYSEWINTYGTHFREQAIFGGDIELFICMNTSLFIERPKQWVSQELKKMYHFTVFDLDHGSYKKKEEIEIDPYFVANSQKLMIFTGGLEKYQDENYLLEWQDSLVQGHRGSVNATLTINSELINDDVKSKTMKDTILDYLQHGKKN